MLPAFRTPPIPACQAITILYLLNDSGIVEDQPGWDGRDEESSAGTWLIFLADFSEPINPLVLR
jgi:hypothetical protein